MDPPPLYTPKASAGSLLALCPPHVLLHLVYRTFPLIDGPDLEALQVQRKNLYWLCTSLRLVNRAFYIAGMHVLRSTYLPHYLSLVRPPYTSDPFPVKTDFSLGAAPLYSPTSLTITSAADPLHSIQRESSVLDLFIAVKVREDVWADDSELHLERHEFFRDLFELHQPRSHLEDLVRIYGVQDSVITLNDLPPSRPTSLYSNPSLSTITLTNTNRPQPSPRSRATFRSIFSLGRPSSKSSADIINPPAQPITPVLFSQLSISFTSRKVALVLTHGQQKRTIVEVQRDRQDRLEFTARQLVVDLKYWLMEGGGV
ncbi:hypothetical protein JOM56_011160 [Amanita muscaria]